MQAKIDTVFNCAAVVKHFSEGTEIEDVNVGGVQRCVDFCVATGAKLVHISTASTRGLNVNSSMEPGYVFTEQQLYGGQYLGNQYTHSKFLAERVVLQAVAENGLVAKVIRVGNLSARSTDGEFQINFSTNAFMGRIKVYNMLATISNGRSDLRISNTTGMFVNTLALSAQIGEQKVMDFLKETSQNFDETLTHEKYPFAQIAADYDLSAEIMFAYQMGVIDQYVVNGQKLEIESLELKTPKFRIAFYIQEKEGVPGVMVEYDNGRYSHGLMQSLAQSVCNAANAFIHHPEVALQQVSLLDAEQTALLDSFNQTDVPYDDTQNIVSLFRRQVAQTPDNLAVVYHDHRYTYREVDELSERIAGYVKSQGLGNEDVVSVLIPRCEWMAIVSLGVLKAGCAYQPLDPSYPAERLNFMMKDADAKLLIADEELRPVVDEYQGKVLLTKDIDTLPVVEPVKADITPSSLHIRRSG